VGFHINFKLPVAVVDIITLIQLTSRWRFFSYNKAGFGFKTIHPIGKKILEISNQSVNLSQWANL
jgi:hypothetical protein